MILVYNAKSGGSFGLDALRAKFKQQGIPLEKAISIENLDRIDRYLNKKTTVVVVGGDGTMSAVARKLVGTSSVLAPLPGGTLNHFTKDLGIEQEFDNALSALADGKAHLVDVGIVNNRVFINNSSLGMYPTSLRVRRRYERYIGKWPAAILAALRGIVRFRSYTVAIGNEVFKTPFVFIGNNTYQLDMPGVPVRTQLDRGNLCIFMAKTDSRWRLVKIALLALIGKIKNADEFEVRTGTEVTIRPRHPRPHVSCDGEVIRMEAPLRYKIQSKALRVLY